MRNLGGTIDSNVWHGTTARSSGQTFRQQLIQETSGLSRKLSELDKKVTAINDEFSTRIGHSWDSVEKGIKEVTATLGLPLFPYWWSELAKRDALLSGVRREAMVQRSLAAIIQNYQNIYSNSVLDAPLDDWMNCVEALIHSYKEIGYDQETAGERYLTTACQNIEIVGELLSDLTLFAVQ